MKSDIAALEAAEEVCIRYFAIPFSYFVRIETLNEELKSLENAAIPAEIVRADQLKPGDAILDVGKIRKVKSEMGSTEFRITLEIEGYGRNCYENVGAKSCKHSE